MCFVLYHFKRIKVHGGAESCCAAQAAGHSHLQKISKMCPEKSPLFGSVLRQSLRQALLCCVLAPCEEFRHLPCSSREESQHRLPYRKDISGSQDSFQQWQQVSPLKKSICQTKTQTCVFEGTRVHLSVTAVSNAIKHWLRQKPCNKEWTILKRLFEK